MGSPIVKDISLVCPEKARAPQMPYPDGPILAARHDPFPLRVGGNSSNIACMTFAGDKLDHKRLSGIIQIHIRFAGKQLNTRVEDVPATSYTKMRL
jgi:hypothetical protein